MEWLDSPGEVASVVAVLAAVLSALIWLIRSQIHMQQQFKPNGGSSAKDSLDRIERKLDRVEEKIDNHITWHLGD